MSSRSASCTSMHNSTTHFLGSTIACHRSFRRPAALTRLRITCQVTDEDRAFMARALDNARKGLGKTAPNPAVGCVVVGPGGEVVGEGYHPQAGKPHAEVYALRAAGQRARGATAYVTLEPCNHHGRTPPCSRALVDAGVARVVVGVSDPNPLVGGQGLQTLRDAGIEAELVGGEAEAACYAINAEWMEGMERDALAAAAAAKQSGSGGGSS